MVMASVRLRTGPPCEYPDDGRVRPLSTRCCRSVEFREGLLLARHRTSETDLPKEIHGQKRISFGRSSRLRYAWRVIHNALSLCSTSLPRHPWRLPRKVLGYPLLT